jgi:hypothetical protein
MELPLMAWICERRHLDELGCLTTGGHLATSLVWPLWRKHDNNRRHEMTPEEADEMARMYHFAADQVVLTTKLRVECEALRSRAEVAEFDVANLRKGIEAAARRNEAAEARADKAEARVAELEAEREEVRVQATEYRAKVTAAHRAEAERALLAEGRVRELEARVRELEAHFGPGGDE